MIIIEAPIAVRFHATAAIRSAAAPSPHNNRSMWSADDVNGVRYAASCRLACSCGFDAPWVRSKINSGTPFTRRNKLVKNRIRASSEHLGSAQDPLKKNEKPSYHPFEEVAVSTSENSEDATLTAAETSRTIIEVNSKATLMFSSLISDEFHENIIWPDLPYLTDEHGNIYFQVKNGEDILQSLTSENNFVEWVAVFSDDDEQEDDDETLADWAKLETMRSSHPVYFAKKLAEIASDDPVDWMEQPPACVAIQGVIRPAFVDEHSTIQKHLSANQSSDTDKSKSIESKGENIGVINGHVLNSESSGDNAAQQVENNGNSVIPFSETSFYKLVMIKIQVFSAQGQPTAIELEDYMNAQPDVIAHSASKIISRLKADGEETLEALKSLCWRCKGIQVEEAQLICLDSLGFDLRVCSGTQIQTLRFTFKNRATSEYSAERQLNDILFPRIHPKQQKMKQTHQNEC
ncbi:Hypothetical protein glysoja_029055 [Glycine soja]|uniref:Uncharacterized protein n=1 Tax=Glycine soja TaxID=3848 RepID=A0A0B2PNM2_GLYSO|nr:Hypothetical protein glysoja_029055 [Glycine soja]